MPIAIGRDIAASIPNAEFLGLESDGHLLLGREPASQVFVEAVRRFLAVVTASEPHAQKDGNENHDDNGREADLAHPSPEGAS